MAGFCPETAGELREDGTPLSDNLFDVLITTDVLAEGVNLQQAGRMINFDLPWNPMKLVQRHGRIDRIGSPHKRVFIGCFFPAENLDELLHLGRRMRRIALQSALGGMGLSMAGMVLAALGYLPPVAGAVFQEVIDVTAVLNALRAAWPPPVVSVPSFACSLFLVYSSSAARKPYCSNTCWPSALRTASTNACANAACGLSSSTAIG